VSEQAQPFLAIGEFKRLPLNRAQRIAREPRVSVENGIDPRQVIAEANTLGRLDIGTTFETEADLE
jgi:hypothetical protein